MPTRLIRDGILASEPVCSLSWAAEVFYRRIMSVTDDYGRFSASPKLLRAACYPLQIDKVSDSDIGKWLTQVVEAGLVRVYLAQDGKRYLQIEKFGQQVRSKSKCPAPEECEKSTDEPLQATDNSCSQTQTDAHLGVFVFGVEGEDVNTPLPPKRSPKGSRLPDDWVLPKSWGEWAMSEQPTWTAEHTRSVGLCFADYWQAKPGSGATKLDWEKTWRTWVRKEGPMKGSHQATTQGAPIVSPAIAQTAQLLDEQKLTPEQIEANRIKAAEIRKQMSGLLKVVA